MDADLALSIADEVFAALEAVQVEPVAWLSIDSIGERYLCFSKPQDNDQVQSLYATPQQEAPGWKPIETAPTDGTFFLATDGAMFKVLNWPPNHYMGVWEWNDTRQQWRGAGDAYIAPTHWMPLPTAPKAGQS